MANMRVIFVTISFVFVQIKSLDIPCLFCMQGLVQIQQSIQAPNGDPEAVFQKVCQQMGIINPILCPYIISPFKNELLFVLSESDVDPLTLCSIFFPNCTSTQPPKPWNIAIPPLKRSHLPWPSTNDGYQTVEASSYRILHLTDLHIDREYQEGSEADCGGNDFLKNYWLCCRSSSSNGTVKTPAGKWGMPLVCDIPYRTFDSVLRRISTAHKDIDFIILTGDFEAHDMWNYSREKTVSNVENITAALLSYFPSTPIYVAIGNHEGVPQDSMAPHSIKEYDQRGPQWLYSEMKKMWSNWVPSSTFPDIQYRASYVVCPKLGLRLISLNNIYCSSFNFYIYINQTDPDGTLEWLVGQLEEAEMARDKVHIISHIPPGEDYCLKEWSRNYFNVVQRFQNTIAAQFYGHTHQDHFEIYYDQSGNPFHMNWISPSLTTYTNVNPAYRIYEIDKKTHTVLDAETYRTDVEKANKESGDLEWRLEYTFKSTYNLPDLSPASLDTLAKRLITDPQLFKKYAEFYWRSSYDASCYLDQVCRKAYVCEIFSARSHDKSQCEKLQ